MQALKKEKTEEILRKLTADFVLREATPASLITVTRVELSETGKAAQLFFTTLPENQEDTALKFLMRKGGELNDFVKKKSKIGIVPHLTWRIDYGERNRQRLDEITQEMEESK
ncbi:MAG: Ribosome-binding factor A [Parcubacteria bacterium C7867-005]|nr:MAG: Ribosome-binding factor A [Parcubacteria bacterium C7867-005]